MIDVHYLQANVHPDKIGYLPVLLSERDPRPAALQIDDGYRHGGGWQPMDGWQFDVGNLNLKFPGDPALKALAWMKLRDETIYIYDRAWVVIVSPQGTFEVARCD